MKAFTCSAVPAFLGVPNAVLRWFRTSSGTSCGSLYDSKPAGVLGCEVGRWRSVESRCAVCWSGKLHAERGRGLGGKEFSDKSPWQVRNSRNWSLQSHSIILNQSLEGWRIWFGCLKPSMALPKVFEEFTPLFYFFSGSASFLFRTQRSPS